MARKDFYHECVRRALVKEGWTITHEPLLLPFADTRLEVVWERSVQTVNEEPY